MHECSASEISVQPVRPTSGFHPRYRASLFIAWFMVHFGHFHRRKLFLSGKTSTRYIGIPSISHLTRGISESVLIPFPFWLGMKYPCELL
jgi:hypothetical protein